MSCYVVLMLKSAAASILFAAMPIGECQRERDRINTDFQYEDIMAFCEVKK